MATKRASKKSPTKGKPSLGATGRRQVQTALEKAKAKAKKSGKPLTNTQIRTQRKKLEATILRQNARKGR